MRQIIDFILHIDVHLQNILGTFGGLTYGIIFLIIFIETGVIVFPFLPGDSLIFVIGAFCAKGWMSLPLSFTVILTAAFLGDLTNYSIGRKIGRKAFRGKHIFSAANLEKTEAFFEKYGGKAVIFARFFPIIRTFSPFVAGVGKMQFKKFITYSIAGTASWSGLFILVGYFFGNIPFVKHNFSIVVMAIIIISVLPMAHGFIDQWLKKRKVEA